MTTLSTNPATPRSGRQRSAMLALEALGQSVWLDYLRRGMTRSGQLDGLIRDGLRGMTSNPTIFEHAIAGSTDYDETLKDPALSQKTDRELFEVWRFRTCRRRQTCSARSMTGPMAPTGSSRSRSRPQ